MSANHTRCPECDREFHSKQETPANQKAAVQLQNHLLHEHGWDSLDAFQTALEAIYPEENVWPTDTIRLGEMAEV